MLLFLIAKCIIPRAKVNAGWGMSVVAVPCFAGTQSILAHLGIIKHFNVGPQILP